MNVVKMLAALAREAERVADQARMRGSSMPDPAEIARQTLARNPEAPPEFFPVLVRLIREHLDELETPVG